jgi:hypothetical protein
VTQIAKSAFMAFPSEERSADLPYMDSRDGTRTQYDALGRPLATLDRPEVQQRIIDGRIRHLEGEPLWEGRTMRVELDILRAALSQLLDHVEEMKKGKVVEVPDDLYYSETGRSDPSRLSVPMRRTATLCCGPPVHRTVSAFSSL